MVERWKELSRQLELWVEIHELNEQGENYYYYTMQKLSGRNLLRFLPYDGMILHDSTFLRRCSWTGKILIRPKSLALSRS